MNQRIVESLLVAAAACAQSAIAQVTPADADNAPATADSEARPVSFELGAGLEYDSNVAVLEIDSSSNQGDTAALLDFGVGYDAVDTGSFDLSVGYNFSDTRHQDFSDFDVRIHRGSADMSYDLGRVDAGMNLQYAHAELDGTEFLVLRQISPYLSKLVGNRLFLRFAYADTDKTFAANPGRDAGQRSLSSDVYLFVNGLSTYLSFGYRYNDEDAIDGQFDYTGDRIRVQLTKRLELDARTVTFRSSLQSESRDYANPTLSIGELRRDDRYQFETTAEVPLGERVVAELVYRYADNGSNLPSLDFDENVVSVSFRANW